MATHPEIDTLEYIRMETGCIGRFPAIAVNGLGLFYMAVGFFQGQYDNQYPYMVCLSSGHRAKLQEALALMVDGHEVQIAYRPELDACTFICQAEKLSGQRREK